MSEEIKVTSETRGQTRAEIDAYNAGYIYAVTDYKARLLERLAEADPLNLAPKIIADVKKIIEEL